MYAIRSYYENNSIMKLSLLLLGLSIKMKMANKNNDLFRQRLKTRTGSILIRTADRSVGRLFTFSKGHIFTKAERFGDADVQMVWKDVNVAFKTMTSSDPQALFRAIVITSYSIHYTKLYDKPLRN